MYYEIKEGAAAIVASKGRDLAKIKEMGYDVNSSQVNVSEKILFSDEGGTRNCLTAAMASQHKCLPAYVERFDINYKANTPDNASIGAENYYAAEFDEYADTTTGYDGINYTTGDEFTHEAVYAAPGHDLLVLHHRTGIRDKLVKYLVVDANNKYKCLAFGRNVAVDLSVNVDENDEFISNNEYTVTIG